MEKTKVKIFESEDKESQKTGKTYSRFRTQIGWMSCFEADEVAKLKANIGNDVVVNIKEIGNFKNIKKVYDNDFEDKPIQVVRPGAIAPTAPSFKNKYSDMEANKQAGVATRYAVDLCIAGKIEYKDIRMNAKILHKLMRDIAANNDTD